MANPADLSRLLFETLLEHECRIVFAESCTGGMVACEMTKIAGVSEVFCGSSVTYRSDTKQQWLGVSGETMDQLTDVAAPVAHQMAQGALKQTPEADIAVSVTGHLGPEGFDAVVFIGVARLRKGKVAVKVERYMLETNTRAKRQVEATVVVLEAAVRAASS